jgi:hypothetical protein
VNGSVYPTPMRVTLWAEDAAMVVAALRYWRDTYVEQEGQEATHLYIHADQLQARIARGLDRRRRGRMSATFQMPFRVKALTAVEAVAIAKAQANATGWTVRTLASCRQQPNGDWLVTLAVYASEKGVPA